MALYLGVIFNVGGAQIGESFHRSPLIRFTLRIFVPQPRYPTSYGNHRRN